MNNLSNSMKKMMGNKNTVTIVGVLLCIIIIYAGYNFRINQEVKLTRIPYAIKTIQPKTKITTEMVSYIRVPQAFLQGTYYTDDKDIIGKYSNYNTIIAEGSIFYKDLVIEEKDLPDAAFIELDEKYTPINYKVDMDTTYANSMMPNSYINIYFKGPGEEGKLTYGKFIVNVKVLAVKDENGKHVFENTEEERQPAYLLFGLPEDFHILFRKALYLQNISKKTLDPADDVEVSIVPNTSKIKEDGSEEVSSEQIKEYIEKNTSNVDITTILSNTEENVGEKKDSETKK